MSDRRAAIGLRLLAPFATGGADPASGDNLANWSTWNLPNHALVWAGDTLMQFDRNDNSSAEVVAGVDNVPIVIVPANGPGRWKALAGEGFERLGFNLNATNFTQTIVTTGANEWSVLPAASYVLSEFSAPALTGLWALTQAGALLTYSGPRQRFHVTQRLTVTNDTGANSTIIQLALSQNPADIGTTDDLTEAGSVDNEASQLQKQLVHDDIVRIDPGGTIQPIFRAANGNDFVLVRYHLSMTPI